MALKAFLNLCVFISSVRSSFVCRCQPSCLYNETSVYKGHDRLSILHRPTQDLVIVCSNLDSQYLVDIDKNNISFYMLKNSVKFHTFNFTMGANYTFKVTLEKEIFMEYMDVRSFEFVNFGCSIYVTQKAGKEVLHHVKIYLLPEFFAKTTKELQFLSDGQNIFFASSLCNDHITFGIEKKIDVEGKTKFYGRFGNKIFYAVQLHIHVNESIKASKIFVASQNILIALSNNTLLKITLNENLVSTLTDVDLSSLVFVSHSIFCPVLETPKKLTEALILVQEIGNQSIIKVLPFPYENNSIFSINTGLLEHTKVIDGVFDFGRRQIVLLVEQTNGERQINVLLTSGALVCKPWEFYLSNQLDKFKIDSFEISIFTEEDAEKNRWISIDGGCTWRISYVEFVSFGVIFLTPGTMLLQHDQLNITRAVNKDGFPLIWTDFGVLVLQSVKKEPGFPFYLNNPVSESTNPFLAHHALLLKNQNGGNDSYTIILSSNISRFPESWKGTTIVSFKNSLCCHVKEVTENKANVTCKFLHSTNVADEIHLKKKTWLNADLYHTEAYCETGLFMNQSYIHLNSPIFVNVSYMILSRPLRHVPVFQLDPHHMILQENFSSHITVGVEQNLCFYEKYRSIQDILLQTHDHCPLLFEIDGPDQSLIYLDITDEVTLAARITVLPVYQINEDLRTYPWLQAQLTNPTILALRTRQQKSLRSEEMMMVVIQQKWFERTLNLLTIEPRVYHSQCQLEKKVFHILNTCPPDKKLIFEYPDSLTTTDFSSDVKDSDGIVRVFHLPKNYQPPSAQGRGIPQSKNVYNADPTEPMYHQKYLEDQTIPEFKQCKGKENRTMCNCALVPPTTVSQSDCIDKVYRLIYREKLVPRLVLQRNEKKVIFSELLKLTELNFRMDYILADSVSSGNLTNLISMAHNTSIELKGSGLYHFHVDIIKKNISYCDFQTEFLVYVDGTPLPYPVDDVIRACSAFVFGFILLALFLYQYLKGSRYDY